MEILAKYKWIHNFQVTKFFIDEPWNHIPEEVKTLQVFMLNEEQIKIWCDHYIRILMIYVYAYIGFFILGNFCLLLFYYKIVCCFFYIVHWSPSCSRRQIDVPILLEVFFFWRRGGGGGVKHTFHNLFSTVLINKVRTCILFIFKFIQSNVLTVLYSVQLCLFKDKISNSVNKKLKRKINLCSKLCRYCLGIMRQF